MLLTDSVALMMILLNNQQILWAKFISNMRAYLQKFNNRKVMIKVKRFRKK